MMDEVGEDEISRFAEYYNDQDIYYEDMIAVRKVAEYAEKLKEIQNQLEGLEEDPRIKAKQLSSTILAQKLNDELMQEDLPTPDTREERRRDEEREAARIARAERKARMQGKEELRRLQREDKGAEIRRRHTELNKIREIASDEIIDIDLEEDLPVVNRFYDLISKIDEKLYNLRTHPLAKAIAITLALDILQSSITGKTVLRKILESPVTLLNWFRSHPKPVSTELVPRSMSRVDVSSMRGKITREGLNEIYKIHTDQRHIRVTPNYDPGTFTSLSGAPVQEFTEAPTLPSQPNIIPENERVVINSFPREVGGTALDREDPYIKLVQGLRQLYLNVITGREGPETLLGHIEPKRGRGKGVLRREYRYPRGIVLNDIIHRAPPHNKAIEEKQKTLIDIPNQSVLDPQVIINRMKARNGKNKDKFITNARSTREDARTEATRLER